jgi:hypothetical protein
MRVAVGRPPPPAEIAGSGRGAGGQTAMISVSFPFTSWSIFAM